MANYYVDTYGKFSQRLTLYGNTTLYDALMAVEKFVRTHPEFTKKGAAYLVFQFVDNCQTIYLI